MNMKIKAIREEDRNINWEEVEWKIAIICNKFRTSVESRYLDDLAQELRIHAYYKSDDYYDLQRKAIDFWRSMKVNVMPEMPYFDLEFIGGIKEDDHSIAEFDTLVELIKGRLETPCRGRFNNEIRELALQIFDIIVSDIDGKDRRLVVREGVKYAPYHNSRISCSYLWEVLGEEPGAISYQRIRKAVKLIENIVRELDATGLWDVDSKYLE